MSVNARTERRFSLSSSCQSKWGPSRFLNLCLTKTICERLILTMKSGTIDLVSYMGHSIVGYPMQSSAGIGSKWHSVLYVKFGMHWLLITSDACKCNDDKVKLNKTLCITARVVNQQNTMGCWNITVSYKLN